MIYLYFFNFIFGLFLLIFIILGRCGVCLYFLIRLHTSFTDSTLSIITKLFKSNSIINITLYCLSCLIFFILIIILKCKNNDNQILYSFAFTIICDLYSNGYLCYLFIKRIKMIKLLLKGKNSLLCFVSCQCFETINLTKSDPNIIVPI